MYATKLKGQVTPDRRLVVENIPREVEPGEVEVILLHSPAKTSKRHARNVVHPAFGIWAKRAEITDSTEFAVELRRRIEQRDDGNGRD